VRISSTDGVELVLHDLGGHGPALLVGHATGFCGAMYQPMATHLTHRFHVLAVDFRGHGDSSAPADGSMSWEGMGRDLAACLDAIGGGPIVGFGHSMGGAVSLMVARQRPEAFSHLFLFEPIVPPVETARVTGRTGSYMSDTARRRRAAFPSKADAIYRYAARPPLNVMRADALYAYVEHGLAEQPDGSAVLKCTPENEARTFEGAGTHLHAGLIGSIATPTLIAVGGQERELPPAGFARGAVDALPHGRLVEFPTLGHFGPFQDPLLVAETLLAFVDAV